MNVNNSSGNLNRNIGGHLTFMAVVEYATQSGEISCETSFGREHDKHIFVEDIEHLLQAQIKEI